MSIIEKKCWTEYFEKILTGEKKVEVRLANFECTTDDIIILREWNPKTKQYTGRTIRKMITNVVRTKELSFWSEQDIEQYGYQIISLEEERYSEIMDSCVEDLETILDSIPNFIKPDVELVIRKLKRRRLDERRITKTA